MKTAENKSYLMKKQKLSSLDHQYDDILNNLFNKRYEIINKVDYTLPKSETLFTTNPWKIEKLQHIKTELNEIKSRLNDFAFDDWHRHTRQRNKAGDVQWHLRRSIEPELLTQAWCKFYENISSFPLIPKSANEKQKFTSVHLCEAPGAFITSLNHWLNINTPKIQWDWLAMTLNPYYEGNSLSKMINDDRLIIYTLKNWFFGSDNTGDLMNLENLDALVKLAKDKDNILLVTADGSIDCMNDPGEQESIVTHLHFCEAVAAMHLLEVEGSLLLKMFTIFEHQSICLVYLLSCLFYKVYVNKPATSKEGNSETYLVCLGFKGQDFISPYLNKLREHYKFNFNAAMFCKDDIPASFIDQIIGCSTFFKEHQCQVILNNIDTFMPNNLKIIDPVIRQIRHVVAKNYIRKCQLKKLKVETLKIIDSSKDDISQCIKWTQMKMYSEPFNAYFRNKSTKPDDGLMNLLIKLQDIELAGKMYSFQFSRDSCELSITQGKPYTKILSSKFCTLDILKIQRDLYDIVEKLDLQINLPTDEKVIMYKKEINSSTKILDFKYTDLQTDIDVIITIHKALLKIREGDNLMLIGYCLLTQFNVSVLYLLAHTFQSLELILNEELGCVITLKTKKVDEMTMDKFDHLLNAMKAAKAKESIILSLFPITVLCDGDMYPAIIEVNSWIIKNCVKYIAELRNI